MRCVEHSIALSPGHYYALVVFPYPNTLRGAEYGALSHAGTFRGVILEPGCGYPHGVPSNKPVFYFSLNLTVPYSFDNIDC
jgi:hypothetical protein